MGTIRLLLALAVVFGHASAFGIIPPYTSQLGYFPVDATLAVHLFFVVSGFYMGLVLDEKYRNLDGWVWRFYLNRYLRLMPTYLVVVAVVTFTVNQALRYPPPGWSGAAFTFSSLTLFGIDLTAFYDVGGHGAQGIIPINQAWSLGNELEFYLLVPVLALLRTRTLVVITVVALCARLLTSGADVFVQQRVFPLVLYFFLLGLLSHRLYRQFPKPGKIGWLAIAGAVFMSAFSGFAGAHAWAPYSAICLTTLLALLIPPIFALTRDWRFDRTIGELSYPVYIVHVAIGQLVPWSRTDLWTLMLCSIAAAVPLFVLIELPMETIRGWISMTRSPRAETPVIASSQPAPECAG